MRERARESKKEGERKIKVCYRGRFKVGVAENECWGRMGVETLSETHLSTTFSTLYHCDLIKI